MIGRQQRLRSVVVVFALMAACSPQRLVPLAAPSTASSRSQLNDITFVVRDLKINGPSRDEQRRFGPMLREKLADYVRAQNDFAKVLPTADGVSDAKNCLFADITVDASHTINRSSFVDYAFYWLLGLLSPQWGSATVRMRLTAADDQLRPVLMEDTTEMADYSMVFFSWYRTGPEEDAYRRAYEQAFESMAKKIAIRSSAITAAMAPRPQPAATAQLLTTVAPFVCSGPARTLAVLPLQIKRIEAELGMLLEQILVSNVAAGGCFKVTSAADINAMLGLERMKDAMGCSDTACAAEIGGALGVELLLSGTVGRLGDSLVVSLAVIDIAKNDVIGRVSVQMPNDENQMPASIRATVHQLFGKMNHTAGG